MLFKVLFGLYVLFGLVECSVPLWCGKPYEIFPKDASLKRDSSKSDSVKSDFQEDHIGWAAANHGNPMVKNHLEIVYARALLNLYTHEKVAHVLMTWNSMATYIECFNEKGVSVGGLATHEEINAALKRSDRHGNRLIIVPIQLENLVNNHNNHVKCTQFSSNPKDKKDDLSTEIVTVSAEIRRYNPHPSEVKINTLTQGIILANDVPFIPMGFFLEWNRRQTGGENFTIAMYPEVSNGFNVPLPYRVGSPEFLVESGYLEFLDNMEKMGMKVHFDLYGTGMAAPSPEKTALITEYVNLVKDHPALLAYYIADEPDGNNVDPLYIKDTFDIIKTLDPYHPLTVVLNCLENPMYPYPVYFPYGDIIMSDPYPIGLRNPVGCDLCEGSIVDVYIRVKEYVATLNEAKPYWTIPQAFGGGQHWDRQPNAREMRAMTYISVIEGSTGIQHFALDAFLPEYQQGIRWEPKDHMWGETRRVAIELGHVGPALLSEDPNPSITLFTPGLSAKAYLEKEKGVITILIANLDRQPKVLDFKIDDLTEEFERNAEVLFEQRYVTLENSLIHDTIDSYGTRAYRIYSITYLKAIQDLRNGNLILNPSFEIQHHVGFPDSYLVRYGDGGSVLSDSWNRVNGYNSIRLINPGLIIHKKGEKKEDKPTKDNELLIAGVESFLGSRLYANNTYIATVYAKAETDGAELEFGGCIGTRTVTLTRDWQPHGIIGTVTADMLCSIRCFLLNQGIAYIDALSLRLV